MSTETTNKKIKIDNGTTFGRTYTDKAVDELLKNAGGGGTSVIELTDKNGTIASTQLGEINANPQNFAFKYNGKILLFTKSDSTTYQYCNNTASSSDNNVMTTSTLLTITSSTGAYTIAENVHNVVANSIHPANGGDLTNIQVGSKVYSIPNGGGGGLQITDKKDIFPKFTFEAKAYKIGDETELSNNSSISYILDNGEIMRPYALGEYIPSVIKFGNNAPMFIVIPRLYYRISNNVTNYVTTYLAICIKEGTLTQPKEISYYGKTYKVSSTN